jgi:hypothetical protein
MKTILIAATTVGAAIAGIILYMRKQADNQLDKPKNGFASIDGTIAGERNMIHTMG